VNSRVIPARVGPTYEAEHWFYLRNILKIMLQPFLIVLTVIRWTDLILFKFTDLLI